jgi:hypothetical protein
MPAQSHETAPTHIVYDKVNGRIVGQYRHYQLRSEAFTECDHDKVLDLFRHDENILNEVTERDPENLAVLCSPIPLALNNSYQYVELKSRRLLELPRLRLRAERESISGDGNESIEVTVDVIDRQGQIQRNFSGPVHISTTRGKLSVPGGRLTMKRGVGKFQLTSSAETVEKVRVRARALNAMAAPDQIVIQFE